MTTEKSILELYQDTIIRLVSRHPFYAHILLQLKVSFNKEFPTAGVYIKDSTVNMIIGENFFRKLTEDQRIFILMHEMAHIILGHLGEERKPNKEDHKIANIAMDTAIHEILTQAKVLFKNSTDMSPCTVESLRELCEDPTIKSNETSEYYFTKLKNLKDKIKEKIMSMSDFDEHGFNQDGEGISDSDVGKAITVGLLENAKKSAGAGDIPGQASLTIEKFKKSKLNWRAILRRYVTSSVDHTYKITRNKRNKRYGFMVPGKRRQFLPTVAFIVDTSGSMTKDMLESAVAEMEKLEKQGFEIWIIEADASVQKKAYEFNKKNFKEFSGGGGTLYQPALDEAARIKCDVAVYVTDMDPADNPIKPKFPVIWLKTANGSFKPTFGRELELYE